MHLQHQARFLIKKAKSSKTRLISEPPFLIVSEETLCSKSPQAPGVGYDQNLLSSHFTKIIRKAQRYLLNLTNKCAIFIK